MRIPWGFTKFMDTWTLTQPADSDSRGGLCSCLSLTPQVTRQEALTRALPVWMGWNLELRKLLSPALRSQSPIVIGAEDQPGTGKPPQRWLWPRKPPSHTCPGVPMRQAEQRVPHCPGTPWWGKD